MRARERIPKSRRLSVRDALRCVLCEGLLPVHVVLCSRCERAACAEHLVIEDDFEWLCPGCVNVLGGALPEGE